MLLKLLRETKNEVLGQDFFMWEADSNRANCRICDAAFGTFVRRHHCRLCGGIFCEPCTATNVRIGEEEHERVCAGCLKGEVPGHRIRSVVETKIKTFQKPPADYIFTLRSLPLEIGSPFERTPSSPMKSGAGSGPSTPTAAASSARSQRPAPSRGYFEFVNKSSSFCAVKVMVNGREVDYDTVWEIPRASYLPVPPLEIASGEFGDVETLELFVLFGNPNPIPEDTRLVNYQTGSMRRVSPCAAVENFGNAAVYRVTCSGCNVLLKFKGDGVVETRAGNSLERNGLTSFIFGKRTGDDSRLDFDTNIPPSALVRFV